MFVDTCLLCDYTHVQVPIPVLNSRLGLLLAIQQLMRVKPAGLLYSGLPCNSFVWISRAATGRSYESPKGNPYSNAACKGNTLCTRFVLLALLGLIRRVWWLVEQPGSSLAYLLPVVQWLMRANGVHISFVPGTLQRLLLVAKLLHEWQTNQNQQHHFYPALEIDLSWMGLYGSQTLKRSLAFGNW